MVLKSIDRTATPACERKTSDPIALAALFLKYMGSEQPFSLKYPRLQGIHQHSIYRKIMLEKKFKKNISAETL